MVDNKEGDFTVNSLDEKDQKNNLVSTMRFDLINLFDWIWTWEVGQIIDVIVLIIYKKIFLMSEN